MTRQEPVGSISRPSDYGSGDAEVPEFIRCEEGREPQIHEVWDFGEDGVTREIHPTAQVDVSAGVFGEFATNCLTESWRRIPIFGRIFINGNVEYLGIPDFHRTVDPAWTAYILSPRSSWGEGDTTTNKNWGSQLGGDSGSVAVPWNCPVCVLPVYRRRVLESMRSAAHCVRDNRLLSNSLARMRSPSTSRNHIRNPQVNWCDDCRDSSVDQ